MRSRSRFTLPVLVLVVMATAGAGGGPSGGTEQWVARYDGPAHGGEDTATALAVSPDGSRVYVTGGSDTTLQTPDFATISYSAASGHRLWAARLGLVGAAHDIATSPDGTQVFVTGEAFPGETADYGTVAYDAATGSQLWFAGYDSGAGDDRAAALAVSPDGSKIFVTGSAALPGSPGTSEYTTVAYDAASGGQLWTAVYGGVNDGGGAARSIAVSPGGTRVYVTGGAAGPSGLLSTNFASIAYDAETGTQLWLSTYRGPVQDDVAFSIGAGADGTKVFVTGSSMTNDGSWDFLTASYDAVTGTALWVRRDAKGALPATLAVGPLGGRVYVTGESDAGDYRTVAYNANGTRAWVATYDGGSGDVATAVAVRPDTTHVYVTGSSNNFSTGFDYAIVAYEGCCGRQLWVARYDGPGHGDDEATGIGVSPDGNWVYITGGSEGPQFDHDYATVTYGT